MSTLSSASTDSQVWDAYDDNASYEEDASASKARAFVTACRILLRRQPKRVKSTSDGSEIEFDPARISQEMEEARRWISSNPVSGGASGAVKFPDFAEFRG